MYTKTKLRRAQNIDKFEEIYEKLCTIYANEFEQKINNKHNNEKSLKKKRFWMWLFGLVIILSIVIIAYFGFSNGNGRIVALYGTAGLFFYPLLLHPTVEKPQENSIETDIKERLIGTLIKEMYPNVNYYPFVKHKKEILEQYCQKGFEAAHVEWLDDEIVGIIDKNIDIRISNIKHTSKASFTKFHGLFAEFPLNKNINADIRILLADAMMPESNYIENREHLKKVVMDNSNFEKEFNVYTDNKYVANQILTSTVLEQLTSYYKNFGMTFELTLQNNEAALRIDTGAMFESLTKENLFVYYSILNFTFNLVKKIYNIIENTDI